MVDKNRTGGAANNETNPASVDERKIDEGNNSGDNLYPAHVGETGEVTGTASSPKYLWMGFGVVVAVVVLIVVIVLINGQAAAETPAPATLSQTAAEGKALFLANNCATCHLAEGRAGGTGPRLSTTGKNDENITNIIRRGRGSMPPNSRLNGEEISKIITYIREIKPPPPIRS
jgi:mono/diheme cytochrome c family protein